jgi:hypothetical protein
METVTLGALLSSLPVADSVHQEFPIMIAVGGGHRKLLRRKQRSYPASHRQNTRPIKMTAISNV